MGWLEMQRDIKSAQKKIIISKFNKPTFEWWKESLDIIGKQANGIILKQTPPKREMIDPTKEVPAKIKEIRSGMTSLSEVIRETGKDPMELLEEKKLDNERIDKLQLILDSDPRKVNQSGSQQEKKGLQAE